MRITIFLLTLLAFSCQQAPDVIILPDKILSGEINGLRYESGDWTHPDYNKPFQSHGNHRILIQTQPGDSLVQVLLPWRRHDDRPEEKALIITTTEDDTPLSDYSVLSISQESGHLVFRPLPKHTDYFVYYLPHTSTGGYYPKVTYLRPSDISFSSDNIPALSDSDIQSLPLAKVLSAQSIDAFHSFYPMETPATQAELSAFINDHPRDVFLFPEYRDYPIAMQDQLPWRWVSKPLQTVFQDVAQQGEYFTFQIGLYPHNRDLKDVVLHFSDLSNGRHTISANRLTCFNTSGTDLYGNSFRKKLEVPRQTVQALWIGMDIPQNAHPGIYTGEVAIQAGDFQTTLSINIQVTDTPIANHGDDEPWTQSRLRWLNSTLGTDTSFIVPPFTPVTRNESLLHIMGRDIELGKNGLPEQIRSFFPQEMTYISDTPSDILAYPMEFEVLPADGKSENWENDPIVFSQPNHGQIQWQLRRQSERCIQDIEATLEYDGMLLYNITLSSREDLPLQNTIFRIPWKPEAATYMLGLGKTGGRRPERLEWNWDITGHHEGLWLGDVNKGLQYVLRDDKYVRPLNTNFYQNQPLLLPESWGNEGKGGIRLQTLSDQIKVENYSGSRTLKAGEKLVFQIRFLITPFKSIDTQAHFNTRFVHKYVPVDTAIAQGGTVINVHHANEINPYINYPFYQLEQQKAYIDEAHSKGVKVKLYNTIREITYKAYELFPMRSLGDEILNDGAGGGHTWLQEHLGDHYHAAWHATNVNDAAILNKGTSRWTNYYIEGLNWLAKNQEIDGLYLDDIAFSRETVRRLTQVLAQNRPEVIIDLHSANQFNARDGYINSAFLYMEHIPYVTRLWFGEYFDYSADPDYWITEVSGIPFGIGGEMLEKGGHPFRGLVYGMTTRVYGNFDPSAIWQLFDDFDIASAKMMGYWVDHSPLKIKQKDLKSTLYLHPEKAMIAIGSWSDQAHRIQLDIDWQALGWKPDDYELIRPPIEGLQTFEQFETTAEVTVAALQGTVLLLQKKN